MDVFDLVAKITLDTREYDSALSGAGDRLSGFGSAISGGLGTIAKVGAAAITAASGAVVTFGKRAVDAGKAFDSAMGQVQATAGLSAEEMEGQVGSVDTAFGHFEGTLREFAQYMGGNTSFSATQAAQALNYMALAGYDAQKSMNMLPAVLNMAAAGGMDLALASDMITDTQSALGLSFERTSLMVQEFAKAASTGNTNVQQLGEAFLRVGGLAKETNGGFVTLADGTQVAVDNVQEMEIAFTAMANAGIKGAEAGTHMRNMLMKLSGPTSDGTKALEAMGVEVFDTSGKMRSLNDIFSDLNGALNQMSQQEKITIIQDLFNARDLASAEALLGAVDQDWDKIGESILNAWYNEEQFDSALQNLAGINLNDMRSNFEKLGVTAAEFQSALLSSGGDTQKFKTNLMDAADEGTKMAEIMGAIGVGTEDLANIFKEMTGAADEMAETQLDNLAGDTVKFNSALEVAQIALSDQLMPYLREFVQMGTSGLSQVTQAFKEGGLEGAFASLGDWLADSAGKLTEYIPNIVDAGVQLLDGLGQGLLANQDVILDAIDSVVKTVLNAFSSGNDSEKDKSITSFLSGLVNIFTNNLPQMMAVGSDIIMAILNAVLENADEMVSAAKDILEKLMEGVVEYLPDIVDGIVDIIVFFVDTLAENTQLLVESAVTILTTIANAIIENIPQLLPAIIDVIVGIITALTSPESMKMLIDATVKLFGAIIGGIANSIPSILGAIGNLIGNIVTAIIYAVPKMVEAAIMLVAGIVVGIGKAVKGVVEAIVNLGKSLVDGFKEFFGIHSPSKVFEDFGKNLIDGLINGIKNMITSVGETIGSIGDTIKEKFTTFFSDATSWGGDLIDNFVGGIEGGISKVGEVVGKVGQKIKDLIGFSEPKEGVLSDFHTYAPDMMKLFASGVEQNEKMLQDQVSQAFDFSDAVTSPEMSEGIIAGNSGVARSKADGSQGAESDKNVTVILELDKMQVAQTVFQLNKEETRRMGVSLSY